MASLWDRVPKGKAEENWTHLIQFALVSSVPSMDL